MINEDSNKNESKEKMYCTSPPRRYLFSTIICLTTKSREFVID